MNRVTEQVKNNTQLFLDELWKKSNQGKEMVIISVRDLDKINKDYKYTVKSYLIFLQKIGCIAYDYFSDYYLVDVKRKEVVK